MSTPARATYLYCVVKSPRKPAVARVPDGVPGASRPRVHAVAPSLWMVSADVPLDVYGPQALEPRLRDLDWVSRVAVAHEAVVEYFSRRRGLVVVPAKLFTMFSSRERAIADVAARRAPLQRVLQRIEGCEEWGVRIFRSAAATATAAPSRPASGAAFLAARKAARDAVADARAQGAAAADATYRALARRSRDAVQRDRRPEPGVNPPILDAAFLVPVKSRAAFTTAARAERRQCAAAGLDLLLTGPWPAYNFIGTPS
jgi:hypothetical protein